MKPLPQQTALSVNLNKVALVRNSRHLGVPSLTRAAEQCLLAGASGITVHPRPDERHIRAHDVFELRELLTSHPDREYNIEGNPFHNLMDFVRQARPDQATFVPDATGQFTSDHGWSDMADFEKLKPLIHECHDLGVRVSLFMNPAPNLMPMAMASGADRVELYTEPFAQCHASHSASVQGETQLLANYQSQLAAYVLAAKAAQSNGLGVNAGHDLNRENLTDFLRAVPKVLEVSIGHALIADALELGYATTVKSYLHCIEQAQNESAR